jgi:putative phage-type endonuclease
VCVATADRACLNTALANLQYTQLARLCAVEQRVHDPIEQNTREWYFMRRGTHKMRVGGSEIGIILGLSRFAKPFSLWEKIIAQQDGEWEQDGDNPEACVHGHTCEDIIADLFADKMGLRLRLGGYYRHHDADLGQFYGASPDRLVIRRGVGLDGAPAGDVVEALLEIKAPFTRMYTDIAPHYMAQVQYQMWVSGVPQCYYLAVKLRHDKPEEQGTGRGPRSTPPGETRVLLALVHYSPEYAAWMIPRLFFFTKCLVERTKPPTDLYESEATGYEAPPVPRVEMFSVPNGAWRVAAKKS